MVDDKRLAERGKSGALARWGGDEAVRFAIDEGEVQFGDLTFRCAVLDDEFSRSERNRIHACYGNLSERRTLHAPV